MTGVTDVRRLNVGGGLSWRHNVVVTTNTRALHFIVVHIARSDRNPRTSRAMAGLTQIRGVNMVGALARGQYTVVTTDTGLCANSRMIKGGDKPIGTVMAHIAGLCRWDMRGAHAGGNRAIMTTRTGTQYLCVIHIGRSHGDPWTNSGMASIAQVGGGDVGGALAGGHSAVMTTDASLRANGAVVKSQDHPGLDIMTGLTRLCGGHMQCAHACGDSAIMTTRAAADDFGMIHAANERYPTARRRMTGVTIV